jgi:hypothetical protein
MRESTSCLVILTPFTTATISGSGSPSQAQSTAAAPATAGAAEGKPGSKGVGCGAGGRCAGRAGGLRDAGVRRRVCAFIERETDTTSIAKARNFFIIPPKATVTGKSAVRYCNN